MRGERCYGSSALDASQEALQGFPSLRLVDMAIDNALSSEVSEAAPEHAAEPAPAPIIGMFRKHAPESQPETTDARQLPATTLDVIEVKHLLARNNRSTPDTRVASLLDYAWDHPRIYERAVPPELLPFILEVLTDEDGNRLRPSQWYDNNLRIIDIIARGKNTRPGRDGRKYEHYYTVPDILEDTGPYDTTSFIRNTITIGSIAWHDAESKKVELSARILVHQAMLAKIAAYKR